MQVLADYAWQLVTIGAVAVAVCSLVFHDRIRATFHKTIPIIPNVKRDWLTTGRLNVRVPPGAIENPNSCFPFVFTCQETQTIEDVSGTLHTVPRFRDLTLNEVRQIMRYWNEMLGEHPDRLAPADPSQHTQAMLYGIPDHQKKRQIEEARKAKPTALIGREANPEPPLPANLTVVVPDRNAG